MYYKLPSQSHTGMYTIKYHLHVSDLLIILMNILYIIFIDSETIWNLNFMNIFMIIEVNVSFSKSNLYFSNAFSHVTWNMADVIIDHQSCQDVKSCRNWVLCFLGVKKTKPTEAKKFTRAYSFELIFVPPKFMWWSSSLPVLQIWSFFLIVSFKR